MAAIQSLNVGRPVTVQYRGKPLLTGIYKQPVKGPLYLSKEQFEGDGQADLVHHGGPDKAVCVYPFEHYSYWESELGKVMDPASFGENFTVTGMLEDEVCIGDTFRVGEAVVQVSQPRYPCFKLSQKHGVADLPARVLSTGCSGFYFRVLEEGYVSSGDDVVQLETHPDRVTVREVLAELADRTGREAVIRRLAGVDALAEGIREQLLRRLDSQE
ncbi:MOSC domain-containing protein [Paenibacillus lemnae]|uniref:MOSC domain-containing protein n=1 Tax=Paenibacillus lemnae TaxID=1330551 RepID=A0A848M2M1_PAELE|nr:MOSC domain-containing protein [Paenibacillus lemnae]NMO94519.1 MOSC domain-containing protein [Paenibacillus lemnae]